MRRTLALLVALLPLAVRAQPVPRVLGLEEAVRTARLHQPQLAQARAAVEASRGRADQARSGLLPQVGAQAQYQRRTSNTGVPAVPGGDASPSLDLRSDLSFTATASQLVWDFGQTSGRFAAARRSADAEEANARESEIAAVLDVRTAFFQARAARDLAEVARAALVNQKAHLAQIDAFVRIGTRPPIDLAQARTDVANAEVQLVRAENDSATARARLNQAMGVPGPVDYEVSDDALPELPFEDAGAEALVAEALRDRPDLLAAAHRVEAADAALGAARGGYGPALSVGVSASDAGETAGELRDRWNVGAGATLSWSVFEGGRTRGAVREAAANLGAASAQAEAIRQQIRLELENARLGVRAAKATVGAAGDAVGAARERLRLAEGRYRTGAGSALELADAQLAATSAEAQAVNAQFQLATARAQLLGALGRD